MCPWRPSDPKAFAWRGTRRGRLDDDDPEGWAIYDQVREATAGEADCHLLTNLTGIGAVEVKPSIPPKICANAVTNAMSGSSPYPLGCLNP